MGNMHTYIRYKQLHCNIPIKQCCSGITRHGRIVETEKGPIHIESKTLHSFTLHFTFICINQKKPNFLNILKYSGTIELIWHTSYGTTWKEYRVVQLEWRFLSSWKDDFSNTWPSFAYTHRQNLPSTAFLPPSRGVVLVPMPTLWVVPWGEVVILQTEAEMDGASLIPQPYTN